MEEHADEAQGWIFAAKAAEAGYVPRTYLELAADDAPAKAPTPEDPWWRGDGIRHAAARRCRRILLCPLVPIAGSPPETAQSPQPQGALEDTSGPSSSASTRSARDRGHGGGRQALRDDGGFVGALGFTGVRGGADDATEFRDDVARAVAALDADRVSWDEFRRGARRGGRGRPRAATRRRAWSSSGARARAATARGRWGSMAGGDDDDSSSSRSSRSRPSRSGTAPHLCPSKARGPRRSLTPADHAQGPAQQPPMPPAVGG